MTIQFRNSQEKLCLVISIPHLVPGFFTGLPGLRATQSASTRTAALSWSWVQPNAMRKKSSASPRSDTHPSGTNSYVRNFNKPFISGRFTWRKCLSKDWRIRICPIFTSLLIGPYPQGEKGGLDPGRPRQSQREAPGTDSETLVSRLDNLVLS